MQRLVFFLLLTGGSCYNLSKVWRTNKLGVTKNTLKHPSELCKNAMNLFSSLTPQFSGEEEKKQNKLLKKDKESNNGSFSKLKKIALLFILSLAAISSNIAKAPINLVKWFGNVFSRVTGKFFMCLLFEVLAFCYNALNLTLVIIIL